MSRYLWPLILLFGITGCGTTVFQNQPATLSAENRAYVTEAAAIRGTLQAQDVNVRATAVAAETLVAQEGAINAVLLATVRAGDPPTVQVRTQFDRTIGNRGTAEPVQIMADGPGGNVTDAYTTSNIRDADGCGQDRQTQFEEGVFRVYAVQEVQQIPANTVVGIEWYYDGALALSDQLRVTEAANSLCVWFYVEPYSTGNWSMQFLSNGVEVGQRVAFRVGQ